MTKDYLPSNRLDLAELIREVDSLVEVFPHEKINILNIPQLDIASDYPKNELLQMCFWVHRHHKLIENSSVVIHCWDNRRLYQVEVCLRYLSSHVE